MRLYKTGHVICDTVSDLIGELPDGDYKIAYGILRHKLFTDDVLWFELDKAYFGANHFDGFYRLSYRGTQAQYAANGPSEPHGQTLDPWRNSGPYTLICPPTNHVCDFFKINLTEWLLKARRHSTGHCVIRHKSNNPLNWDEINKVITFNSTIGFEALKRGIEVISDPLHSTIGSYTQEIQKTYGFDRNHLLDFAQGHQFRLQDKDKICKIIKHYMSI